MLRVVYVHQDGIVSGSALSLLNVLRHIDRAKYSPIVVAARDGQLRPLVESLGVQFDVVPMHGFWTVPFPRMTQPAYFRNLRALFGGGRFRDYLRASRPSIVHVNDKAMLVAGRIAASEGIPVVWHLRSCYLGNSPLQRTASHGIIRSSATRLIAISEDEVQEFASHPGIRIIRNGVDLEAVETARSARESVRRELGLRDDELAIGMIGQLTAEKGAWDFIRAAGIVARKRPNVSLRFVIVAPIPGPLYWGIRGRLRLIDTTHPRVRAERLIREVGIAEHVIFTGARSDVLSMMSAMDIVSVCYRLPALGRPAFEALAIGRAVVANHGHTRKSRVVIDGETGLLVPPASPEQLAESLLRLVDEPDLRQRLAARGAAHARELFDAERNTREVERLYDEIAARREIGVD